MAGITGFLKQFEFKQATNEREALKKSWHELNVKIKEFEDSTEKARIHMINPDRICPNPRQARKSFEEASVLCLADSIRQYGIIQPITVRKLFDDSRAFGGLYELIAGERRLRAAKMLEFPYVPCIIIDADSQEAAKISITENIQREDLNIFEKALAIQSLILEFSLTQEEVAAMLSLSQSGVANKLRILKLTDEERTKIIKARLTERHARELIKIDDVKKRNAAIDEIILKNYNVDKTEEYISRLLNPIAEKPKPIRKFVIKDIRLFLNSIDHAVDIVKQAGIPIEQIRNDDDETISLLIKIPKSTASKGVKPA